MSQDITIADQPSEAIQAVITVILPDGQEAAYELQLGALALASSG